jgi:hypothetical protein
LGERGTPRRQAKNTIARGIRSARSESNGTETSIPCAGKSDGKVSAFPNIGKCEACGKTILHNPDRLVYCDCYSKCEACGEKLILLHRLKGETVKMLHETFGFDLATTVGLCPSCIVMPPYKKGASSRLPQLVRLSRCSGPALNQPSTAHFRVPLTRVRRGVALKAGIPIRSDTRSEG